MTFTWARRVLGTRLARSLPGLRACVAAPSDPPVWVGDWALPAGSQGLVVLGTPVGSDAFIQAALQSKLADHASLLSSIPAVPDLQAAWLLLLLCAAPRSNYTCCESCRQAPPASSHAPTMLLYSHA